MSASVNSFASSKAMCGGSGGASGSVLSSSTTSRSAAPRRRRATGPCRAASCGSAKPTPECRCRACRRLLVDLVLQIVKRRKSQESPAGDRNRAERGRRLESANPRRERAQLSPHQNEGAPRRNRAGRERREKLKVLVAPTRALNGDCGGSTAVASHPRPLTQRPEGPAIGCSRLARLRGSLGVASLHLRAGWRRGLSIAAAAWPDRGAAVTGSETASPAQSEHLIAATT